MLSKRFFDNLNLIRKQITHLFYCTSLSIFANNTLFDYLKPKGNLQKCIIIHGMSKPFLFYFLRK